MPKAIAEHPAVEEVLDGFSQNSDYKYDVWLKPEYRFASGRMEGLRGGRFQTVQDFMNCGVRKILK